MWKADIAENFFWETTAAVKLFATRSIVHVWQGSEYAPVPDSEYIRVLNMPGYTGFWICLNNFWTCLNMMKYVWMCLNLPEWLLFYFPIVIPCLLERIVTYFNVYTKLEVRVKEYHAVFLKRQNLIFSVVGQSSSFVFCFRLNIFTRFLIMLFN